MTYHDISRQLQAGLIPIIQRLLRHLQSWWSPNSIKSSRSVVACCLMSKRIRALSSYGCSCIIQMWKDTHRDLFWSEARCLWRAMQVQCSCNVQHNVTQRDTMWHNVPSLAFFEGFGQGGSQLISAEEFWMGPRTGGCHTLWQSLHETYVLCPFIV